MVQGGGAGLHELEATRAVVGDHPLVVLGLAERLVARGRHAEGVDAYRIALAGSLLELRHPGIASLAAADAAVRSSRLEDAAWFVGMAERHEGTRAAALERRALLEDIDRMARRTTPPPEAMEEPSVDTVRPWRIATGADARVEDLESAVLTATTRDERGRARMRLGRARLERGDAAGAEALLSQALADGLVEAGDILAAMLNAVPGRAHEAVRVRRQQVALEPGDVGRLESLRVAALADDDRVFARAVEHVLRAFDPGAGPLPPPSLATQPEQPGIFALLARPSMDASGEALALLWEGAMQLFVRDAASYGITGVERVAPGPTSVIARLYEAAVRALDAPRIPLFVPRAGTGLSFTQVALLAPPSVILTGDVREDTPELRFALGRGMCAALTHNVAAPGPPGGGGARRWWTPCTRPSARRRAAAAWTYAPRAWPSRSGRSCPRAPSGACRSCSALRASPTTASWSPGPTRAVAGWACFSRATSPSPHARSSSKRDRAPSGPRCRRCATCARSSPPWPICCASRSARSTRARGGTPLRRARRVAPFPPVASASSDLMVRFMAIGLVAAAGGCFAFALATTSACVTAPPPELAQLSEQRPTILHDAVVPPANAILAEMPLEFVVPVELDDPEESFEWDVFVDYNPCADPTNCQPTPPSIYPQLVQPQADTVDGGVVLVSFPGIADLDDSLCHRIDFLVAHQFDSNRRIPGTAWAGTSRRGSSIPAATPTAVRVYDAGALQDGAFPSADTGADGLPVVPESGADP